MAESPELEQRVSALEARVEEVAADAAAARHLAALIGIWRISEPGSMPTVG